MFAEHALSVALEKSQKLSLLAQDPRKVKAITIIVWMDQKLTKPYTSPRHYWKLLGAEAQEIILY